MPDEHELALHNGDLFGVFGLPRHVREPAPTRGASPLGLGQRVHRFDNRKTLLLARAVPSLSLARRGRGRGNSSMVLRDGFQRRLATRLEKLSQHVQFELGLDSLFPAKLRHLDRQKPDPLDQLLVLPIQESRDLPQHLDVLDGVDAEHYP